MINPQLLDELARLDAQGLRRTRRMLQSPQGACVRADGREYLSYCSNDYLGLANHPALVEAACEGARLYGVGAGASHLVSGHSVAHAQLESELARFVGLPQALLFSTGYLANLAAVTALIGRDGTVYADKLNHASLNDAALLARARFRRYPHLDLARLESMLAADKQDGRRKLVATDAVFSMDGDIAPLPQLLALCERHDAWLLVDDAHGFGVLGEGKGALAAVGLNSPRMIYMATLGKAAGVAGAFVAGAHEVIETLLQKARSYIYTTAAPPLLAHALNRALRIMHDESWRRVHVLELAQSLRKQLRLSRWQLLESATPIQALVIGDNREALCVSDGLRERGIWVPAIRPPTVPPGTARLRISLSAAHSPEDVAQLVVALRDLEAQSTGEVQSG